MYDAAHHAAPMPTYATADEAIAQLLRDGFDHDQYDPLYPYSVAWNDGDGMRARVVFCNYRQRYIVEGLRF